MKGRLLSSGSHGGLAAAQYALAHPPRLAVFNDAGVGKDQAGILALAQLEAAGIGAIAVAHTSARIGEAAETWEHGVVSYLNQLAQSWGGRPNDLLATTIERKMHFS